MTENNSAAKAGDQDENASDLVTPQLRGLVDEALDAVAPACGVLVTHDRHVAGPIANPIHCAGFTAPDADPAGYVASFQEWEKDNATWTAKLGPLVHHARVLARKLDADPDAPVALSSAYLQAFTRLEKMRPASAGGGPTAGDGLQPAGVQGSLFEPMED